jgi:GNAT superfamily N-acetyltransferase
MEHRLTGELFRQTAGRSRTCLAKKLHEEVTDGVAFWGYEEDLQLIGVMGIQQVQDVTLIGHAYVRTEHQKHGIGAQLLSHLRDLSSKPVLIGTWADASWAIHFYQNHGWSLCSL